MKIGIIGAGFTGLSAAQILASHGYSVTIFEKETSPGGLAAGFKDKSWKWPLEKYYHHLFTSDSSILDLAKKVKQKIIFIKPKTSTYIDRKKYQLDSPLSLLRFPLLSIKDRIKTGVTLGFLRFNTNWHILEEKTSYNFIRKYAGKKSWKIIWEPLFMGKFGKYYKKISAVWFWARIKKRSQFLGYPDGGFTSLINKIENNIRNNNGKFFLNTLVKKITKINNKFQIITNNGVYYFDKVICTLPSSSFLKITKNLPVRYINKLSQLKNLSAFNLVLSMKNYFLKDGTYWLNVNESKYPFLALVEHTNFINKEMYGNQTILYIGNYLENNHRHLKYTKDSLVKEFIPYLKKINPGFSKKDINKIWFFKTSCAQPIVDLEFSKNIPSFITPIKGLYLANIEQTYPWDRGVNYAVELGQRIVSEIQNNKI